MNNDVFELKRGTGHAFTSKHCFEVKLMIFHDVFNIEQAEIPQLVLEWEGV